MTLALPIIPDWHDGAPCAEANPDDFFPEKGRTYGYAKLICNGDAEIGVPACPVRVQCLAWAVDNNEPHGVWGGLSPAERETLKKKAAA